MPDSDIDADFYHMNLNSHEQSIYRCRGIQAIDAMTN